MEQREYPSVALQATRDILDRDGKLGRAQERTEPTGPGGRPLLSPGQMSDEELQSGLADAIARLATDETLSVGLIACSRSSRNQNILADDESHVCFGRPSAGILKKP